MVSENKKKTWAKRGAGDKNSSSPTSRKPFFKRYKTRKHAKVKAAFIAPVAVPGVGMRPGSMRHMHDSIMHKLSKGKPLGDLFTQTPVGIKSHPINHLLTDPRLIKTGLKIASRLLSSEEGLLGLTTECSKEVINEERRNIVYTLKDVFREPASRQLSKDKELYKKNKYEVVATTPPYDLRSFYVGVNRQAVYVEGKKELYPAFSANDFMKLISDSIDPVLNQRVERESNVDVLFPVVSSHVLLKIQNKNKFLDVNLNIYLCEALSEVCGDPSSHWYSRGKVPDGSHMSNDYVYPEVYSTVNDPDSQQEIKYISENSINFYATPQRQSSLFRNTWKVAAVHKVNLAAGDVLEYHLEYNYGHRTSYKLVTNGFDPSLGAPNTYLRGTIVPMITYRGSASAEIAYQKDKQVTQASSVQLGGPACITLSVRKYFTHVFPSARLTDHTNYVSVSVNDLPVEQRQIPYSDIVQRGESRDGWIVDVMSNMQERQGGAV